MRIVVAAALLALIAAPAVAQETPTLIGPSLRTSAIDVSRRFYPKGLGMVVVTTIPRGPGREVILGFSKDRPQPGIILLSDGKNLRARIMQGNGLSRIILRVPNLQVIADRLKAAGFTPSPIRDVAKGYRLMTVADPDRYMFELVER
jgi:catechol 2,3-dioxygenase-like lactoylglutathione lyase family enzyme